MAKARGKFTRPQHRVFIGERPISFRADPELCEQSPPRKRKPAPTSRKPRKNRGGGPQRLRTRVVLRRIWREEYPTRAEVSDADVWDRFSREYEKIEGKANPPSKHGKPSPRTVRREMGRED